MTCDLTMEAGKLDRQSSISGDSMDDSSNYTAAEKQSFASLKKTLSTNEDVHEGYPKNEYIVISLTQQLQRQKAINQKLQWERDEQLKNIASSLMLLECRLRKEQNFLINLLKEKDNKIAKQEQCIRSLLRLNQKWAFSSSDSHNNKKANTFPSVKKCYAKLQHNVAPNFTSENLDSDSGIHSWNNCELVNSLTTLRLDSNRRSKKYDINFIDAKKNIPVEKCTVVQPVEDTTATYITEYNNNNTSAYNENNSTTISKEVCSGSTSSSSSSIVSVAGENSLDGISLCGDDGVTPVQSQVIPAITHLRGCSSLSKYNKMIIESNSNSHSRYHHKRHINIERLCTTNAQESKPGEKNLSTVYNRVMCNHRSVTKPKDVKYKKISRVKSRSLEELRGHLKTMSQPVTTVNTINTIHENVCSEVPAH